MQFVPQRCDLEQALRKAKPPEYTVPSGRNAEMQQIHDIFVNTPIPPEVFENYRSHNKPKPQEKPQQQQQRKPRDLQAELRALNLVPDSNEGPKRGTGTLLPQDDNMNIPGMPMPGFPGILPAIPGRPRPPPFNQPAFGARNTFGNPNNNIDPNNYDDFQDMEDDENNEEEQEAQNDGNGDDDGDGEDN